MADTAKTEAMGWPRSCLAIGFFMIMVGVVVGAASEGSPIAKYIALAGLVPIAVGIIGLVIQKLGNLGNGRQPAAR